jgi:hypothetical protein
MIAGTQNFGKAQFQMIEVNVGAAAVGLKKLPVPVLRVVTEPRLVRGIRGGRELSGALAAD